MSEKTYLIAGLGNIGVEYALTRHNIGFMTLDAWAQASNVVFAPARYGDIAEIGLKGRRLILLKPSTYMNLSGNAIRYWLQKEEIPIENLIVICDDLNLPFGSIRMRKSGSDGGHNGLKNIQELLETQNYSRIRLGIGNDFAHGQQIDYVLGKFDPEQVNEIGQMSKKIVSGIHTWVFLGPEKAMTQLNTKANVKTEEIEK